MFLLLLTSRLDSICRRLWALLHEYRVRAFAEGLLSLSAKTYRLLCPGFWVECAQQSRWQYQCEARSLARHPSTRYRRVNGWPVLRKTFTSTLSAWFAPSIVCASLSWFDHWTVWEDVDVNCNHWWWRVGLTCEPQHWFGSFFNNNKFHTLPILWLTMTDAITLIVLRETTS